MIPVNDNICGDDVRVAYPLFQKESGGSIPTSPLQFRFVEIPIETARRLNRMWHSRLPEYRVGCRPKQHAWVCYAAEYDGLFYAVAIWSHPNSRFLDKADCLELRRMAISPDSPANTASRMISVMIKLIRKIDSNIKKFISYQDTEVHKGTIYRASGWFIAKESKAMDYSFNNKRHRPKPQNIADKIRWEYSIEK